MIMHLAEVVKAICLQSHLLNSRIAKFLFSSTGLLNNVWLQIEWYSRWTWGTNYVIADNVRWTSTFNIPMPVMCMWSVGAENQEILFANTNIFHRNYFQQVQIQQIPLTLLCQRWCACELMEPGATKDRVPISHQAALHSESSGEMSTFWFSYFWSSNFFIIITFCSTFRRNCQH